MQSFFIQNLKKLTEKHSQRGVAAMTGVSAGSINTYINKGTPPSINFLMRLKEAFGISLDEFLFKELNFAAAQGLPQSAKSRFAGNYIVYYYDTSSYKGRVHTYDKSTLNYAVISVYDDKAPGGAAGNNSLKARGIFQLSRREAEEALKTLNSLKMDIQSLAALSSTVKNLYEGSLDTTASHIFINFSSTEKNDRCFIILNNPPSVKEYLGGLGTSNSISRGRELMPCVQYLLFSRNILRCPDGEIYNLLTLGTFEIDASGETQKLVDLFKNLYLNPTEFTAMLSDYQKNKIIEDGLQDILNDVLESNLFRFAKVSGMEDDRYYRIIKDEAE